MSEAPKLPRTYQAFMKRFPKIGQAWELMREEESNGPFDDKTMRLLKLAVAIGGAGIYFVILLSLSPYILVTEDTPIFEAMRTSIAFVRKILLKIIGLGLLLMLVGLGIGLVIGLLSGLVSLIIKGALFHHPRVCICYHTRIPENVPRFPPFF